MMVDQYALRDIFVTFPSPQTWLSRLHIEHDSSDGTTWQTRIQVYEPFFTERLPVPCSVTDELYN